jgi:hypothetical protein
MPYCVSKRLTATPAKPASPTRDTPSAPPVKLLELSARRPRPAWISSSVNSPDARARRDNE